MTVAVEKVRRAVNSVSLPACEKSRDGFSDSYFRPQSGLRQFLFYRQGVVSPGHLCSAASCIIPVILRWPHGATGHDVSDLITVQGLEAHQGFRHRMQLIQVGRQDVSGTLVVFVNDRPDFPVNGLGSSARLTSWASPAWPGPTAGSTSPSSSP